MASVAEKPDNDKGPSSEVGGEVRAAAGGGGGRVGVAAGRGERDDWRGDGGCCGRSGEVGMAMEKWRAQNELDRSVGQKLMASTLSTSKVRPCAS